MAEVIDKAVPALAIAMAGMRHVLPNLGTDWFSMSEL